MTPSPSGIQTAKENIKRGLQSLRNRYIDIYQKYNSAIDGILNGDKWTIWALIDEIMSRASPLVTLSNERIIKMPQIRLNLENSIFNLQKSTSKFPFFGDDLKSPKQISFLEDSKNFSLNRSAVNEDIFPSRPDKPTSRSDSNFS